MASLSIDSNKGHTQGMPALTGSRGPGPWGGLGAPKREPGGPKEEREEKGKKKEKKRKKKKQIDLDC